MSQQYNHVLNILFLKKDDLESDQLKVSCNIKSPNETITDEEISDAIEKSIAKRKKTHDFFGLFEKTKRDILTTCLE